MRILTGVRASRRVQQLARRGSKLAGLEPAVSRIVEDVRRRGDPALRVYAEKWDHLSRKKALRVPEEELQAAWQMAPPPLRTSLRQAAANIRRFSEKQRPREWRRESSGISVGQVVRPLGAVGCYVPGGRYPLVSTLLMTVIPAQVAGVPNIRVTSPNPSPEVLAAASMLGVREFYRVGGAQAIAALAYGTKSIPRADKIVGPGNAYVTLAKKLVAFDCSIDFLAGPTEVVILSRHGRAEFIAADLVAQAEHDPAAVPVFVTTSHTLAASVGRAVDHLSKENPTANQSLARSGCALVARSRQEAIDWANQIAPEHMTVEESDLPLIQNAGSIFVGQYSAQAAGDYASGPNHVLPTAGAARFRGGLSVSDFVKVISVQQLSKRGLVRIARAVTCLAETEGLRSHAESIRLRWTHA
jgi:histidinol dehydrogenase